MTRYNCRKCLIRNRCIEESGIASSIRLMIEHAFEARTDTLATWGRLQENCLIVKVKEGNKDEGTVPARTALSKRLNRAKKSRGRVGMLATSQLVARTSIYVGREEVRKRINKSGQSSAKRMSAKKVAQLQNKHFTTCLMTSPDGIDNQAEPYWLTVKGSWRHIALPVQGSLILGHFDPGIGIPPDIDLTYEDRGRQLISRRHATIVGDNGKHTIEDLGSVTGVFLNEKKLGFGPSRPLQPGDKIRLGSITLNYEPVPPIVLGSVTSSAVKHTLTITATGEKIDLSPENQTIIGRKDSSRGFNPDINLDSCGQLAQRVSRRHARIVWQDGKPTIEDMGSGFGTRLQGGVLPLEVETPLTPGDHIWLGGCVLAYDIEATAPVPVQKGTGYLVSNYAQIPAYA